MTDYMENVKLIIKRGIRVYGIVFAIIPFLIASLLSVLSYYNFWSIITKELSNEHFLIASFNNKLISFFYALLILLVILINIWVLNKIFGSKQQGINMLYLFLCAFLVRILFIVLFSEDWVPFSDFKEVWELEYTDRDSELFIMWTAFPAYLNFSVLEHFERLIFGDFFTNVLYINSLFAALTSVMIYAVVYVMSWKKNIALLCGLLYALAFDNIIECTWAVPEFLCVFSNTAAILMLLLAWKDNGKNKYLYYVIAGALFGIGASYKSFSIIIIIAFILTDIVKSLLVNDEGIKRYLILLIAAALIIIPYKGVKELILQETESFYGMHFTEASATPHFFMVGLRTEGEGQIFIGEHGHDYLYSYISANGNSALVKDVSYEYLKKDWQENYSQIPSLLAKKIMWVWQSSTNEMIWKESSGITDDAINSPIEKVINDFWNSYLHSVIHVIYILTMLFAAIGAILTLVKGEMRYEFLFVSLIIFGFFCLMLISEAQARYKMLIMPYVYIFSAIGMHKTYEIIKRKLQAHM